MYSVRKLPLLIALASASATSMVSAEDLILDEFVVTGTRSETSIMDLAGNTGKVTEAEIDLIDADHIEELLLRVPGMNLQRGSGVEMTIALRSPVLTGPGAGGAFLFMEDSIALRSAAFGNNQGLSEAHFEQAGSIEVVRGPGSALYGSNAVHGLINVLSRDPSEDLERKLDFTLGSDDLYKVKGTVSDTNGAHAYRFSFSGVDDGGWRDDSGLGQQKATLRHDYFAENGDSFKTIFNVFNLNQNTAGFIRGAKNDGGPGATPEDESLASSEKNLYKDSSLMKTNPDPDAYRDWWSVRLSTRWDHETANGNTLSITPYLRSTEMEFRQHYLPSRAIEENGHDSLGVQTAYYMDLEGGHTVIMGLDAEYTDGHLKEIQDKAYFTYAGPPPRQKKKSPEGVHYDYDVEVLSFAPFIHAEWQLADRLRATTGLRYEHTRYDYNNNVANNVDADGDPVQADGSACPDLGFFTDGCLYRRPEDRKDTFNDWSPKLGLTYRVAENHSTYANLSRGHRAPQTTDLYRLQTFQKVGEVDSEQIDSFEIGFRGQASIVSYDVAVFYMKKKNFFFRDSDGENVTDGKTKHRGIEVAVSLPLGSQFDLAANYTHAIHEYDFDRPAPSFAPSNNIESGEDVDTAPRNIANVRLGWNFKTDSRAELEWSHIGNYYTDPAHIGKYDGHDLFNLRVNTQVTKGLAVHGQVKNVLDEEYADRADYSFGQYRFFPGRGRYYELGASYSF
jgi:iron complex outermembrane receptor protein